MNILITGGNSALGIGLTKYFGSEGNNRILVSSRTKIFDKLEFPQLDYIEGIDLLDESSLTKLYKKAESYFNNEFHIINAVGRYFTEGHKPFLSVNISEASSILHSNYTTVYNTANCLLPLQIDKGGGHFIGFSCTSVLYRYPTMAAFSAAKSALENLIGCLANEYYKDGVIANCFQLSTLKTAEEKKLKPTEDPESWLDLNDVAVFISDFLKMKKNIISGNSMHIYKYSDSFFGKSYYERIKK